MSKKKKKKSKQKNYNTNINKNNCNAKNSNSKNNVSSKQTKSYTKKAQSYDELSRFSSSYDDSIDYLNYKKLSKEEKRKLKTKFLIIIAILTIVITFANIIFQKFVNVSFVDDNSVYFLVYLIALFGIFRFFSRNIENINIAEKISITLIISSGIANFVFRYILSFNVSYCIGDILIGVGYIIFVANFSYFSFKEYVKKKQSKEKASQSKNDKYQKPIKQK